MKILIRSKILSQIAIPIVLKRNCKGIGILPESQGCAKNTISIY